MPMASSSSQFSPSPISNAHPVGSRCGDQHWPNLPSTRYFTACTVPAFCAMVLASDLQSTDSDTNSSRLTALAYDFHWNPVHACARSSERLHGRQLEACSIDRASPSSDYVVRTLQQVCQYPSRLPRYAPPTEPSDQTIGYGSSLKLGSSILNFGKNTCWGRTVALISIRNQPCDDTSWPCYTWVLAEMDQACWLRERFTLTPDWNGKAPEPRSFPRLDSDDFVAQSRHGIQTEMVNILQRQSRMCQPVQSVSSAENVHQAVGLVI
ncbi:hypothetical protein BDP55DRAFT_307872 [Colletotrichum godetiae]|uniref:Uncharacterized protein n=1 Tax=Colletotrichum godetiae TaxID=1209918 RepID=A0AAJ0AXP8_9PEZI|nr:uncharacterized protein BDP55DRAFT_307872 [Colletotrichum godetiae]KAK1690770.1 hypothetical protein BDP55DRAFT_307872 [Colletotrichum godetiae]